MTTKLKSPRKVKLPKARAERCFISQMDGRPYISRNDSIHGIEDFNCVLIPCPTATAAKKRARVENMGHEERVGLIESILIEANYLAFKRHDLGEQITDTVEQTCDYANRIAIALGFNGRGE